MQGIVSLVKKSRHLGNLVKKSRHLGNLGQKQFSSKVPHNDFLQNGLNRRNIIEPTAAKNEGRTNVVPKAEKLVDINNTAPTAHENDRAEKVLPGGDFLIRQFPFGDVEQQ